MPAFVDEQGGEYDIPDSDVPSALESGLRLKADAPAYTPEALPSTPVPGPPAKTVRLVDDEGGEYDVPEAEAQAAIDAGALKQPLLEKIYGGAEALGRGITSGLSDLVRTGSEAAAAALTQGFARGEGYQVDENAGSKAAAEKYAEIEARKERTGGLATGLEAAGAVGSALSGAGLLGKGVQGAASYTPPAMISSLAARAAGGLGTSTVKGRLGQAVVGGALESAMDSASRRVIDDLAHGNYQISAERFAHGLSGVVEDAAIGALAGGAVGGLIEGTAAAARAGKTLGGKLAAPATQAPPAQTTYKINTQDAVLDPQGVAERLGPLVARDVGQVADNIGSDMLSAARGAADRFGDVHQGAVRELSKDLTGFFEDIQDLRDVAGRTAKHDWIKSLQLQNQDFSPALAQIDNVERVLKDRMDNIPAAYLGSSGSMLKQAEEAAAATRQKIMDVYVGKAPADEAMVALDDFKSFLQRGTRAKNPQVQATLESLSENMRLHLEDSSIYGAFGEGQRRLNRPIYEGIAAEQDDAIRGFSKQGSEQSEFDPFLVHKRANEQHIGSFLEGVAGPKAANFEGDEAAFRKYLRLKVIDAQTRAELYQNPMFKAIANQAAERAGRIEDTMNAVILAGKDKKAWDQFSKNAAVRLVGGERVGGLVQLGSAVGRAAKKAAELESSLAGAVEDTVRTTMHGKAARAGVLAAASAGAIKRAIDQARALQDPDSAESARLRAVKDELAADDPAFADAADAQVKTRAKFLADKAGPPIDASDPFGPRPALQSRPEQAALARYAQAAVAPGNALRRLGAGQGTAEDIETLRTLYPALYQDFVQRVQSKMGGNPTARQRAALRRITGLPTGRVDPAWYQQVANAQPEPAQPQAAPSPQRFDPDRVAVRSDTLLSGS